MFCTYCGARNEDNARFCIKCKKQLVSFVPSAPAKLSANSKPLSIQQGRFIVIKKLGSGGMGRIYLAKDIKMDCNVVIKEMFPPEEMMEKKDYFLAKFKNEAKLLYRLSHKGIPRVIDFFSENDCYYIIMQFIEGENLSSIIYKRSSKRITIDEFITWVDKILDILEYLHSQTPPILHRDIKPANIMVDMNENVFLVDFGLSRSLEVEAVTRTQIGTIGFASPEHYTGKFVKSSDIYSLGATFHFLLTGDEPHLRKIFTFLPLRHYIAEAPESLEKLLSKMLEHDTSCRFQSIKELRQDFDKFVKDYSKIEDSKIVDVSDELEVIDEPEAMEPETQAAVDVPISDIISDREMIIEPVGEKIPGAPVRRKPIFLRLEAPAKIEPIPLSLESSVESEAPTVPQPQLSEEKPIGVLLPDKLPERKIFPNRVLIIISFSFSMLVIFALLLFFAFPGVRKREEPKGTLTTTLIKSSLPSITHLPESIDSLIQAANNFMETKEYKKAIEIYSRAIDQDRENMYPEIRSKRGKAHFLAGNYEDSTGDYDAYLKVVPADIEILKERAKLAETMGKLDIAVSDCQKLLTLKIDEASRKEIKNNLKDLRRRRGLDYMKRSLWKEAASDLEYIQKLEQKNSEITLLLARCYRMEGEECFKKGKIQEAYKYFKQSIHLEPGNVETFLLRARAFENQNDTASAIEDLRRAHELSPGNTRVNEKLQELLYERSINSMRAKKTAEAVRDLEKAYKIDTDNVQVKEKLIQAHILRSLECQRKDKLIDAVNHCNRALEVDSSNFEARLTRSRIYLKNWNFNGTIEDTSILIQTKPDCYEAYLIRGKAYAAQKNYAQALAEWQKAVRDTGSVGGEARNLITQLQRNKQWVQIEVVR